MVLVGIVDVLDRCCTGASGRRETRGTEEGVRGGAGKHSRGVVVEDRPWKCLFVIPRESFYKCASLVRW